jgi:septal ring factor EnvC (AmiA/AmiB activator)
MWQKKYWWLLALCLLLGLCTVRTAWGEEPPTQTIAQLLRTADERLTLLETRLQERKRDTLTLQADLMRLSGDLTQARALLDESQTDLTETRRLLDSLTTRYDKLLSDYQASTRKTRRELWLWRGISAASILALIVGAIAK